MLPKQVLCEAAADLAPAAGTAVDGSWPLGRRFSTPPLLVEEIHVSTSTVLLLGPEKVLEDLHELIGACFGQVLQGAGIPAEDDPMNAAASPRGSANGHLPPDKPPHSIVQSHPAAKEFDST